LSYTPQGSKHTYLPSSSSNLIVFFSFFFWTSSGGGKVKANKGKKKELEGEGKACLKRKQHLNVIKN
jgi:hypothetical protein